MHILWVFNSAKFKLKNILKDMKTEYITKDKKIVELYALISFNISIVSRSPKKKKSVFTFHTGHNL